MTNRGKNHLVFTSLGPCPFVYNLLYYKFLRKTNFALGGSVRHGEILLLRNLQNLTVPYRENYGAKWLLHLITVTIYLDYHDVKEVVA